MTLRCFALLWLVAQIESGESIPSQLQNWIPQTRNERRLEPLKTSVLDIVFMSRCILRHLGLVFNGYGCFCGLGGKGTPVDPLDECCRHHDECYNRASSHEGPCFSVLEYFIVYSWTCKNDTIQCNQHDDAARPGNLALCADAMCDCDRNLVQCWAQQPMPTHQPKCFN